LASVPRFLADAAATDGQGDAFRYAFARASDAVAAAEAAQHGLSEGPVRVRMGCTRGSRS